jgi:hypothetical protein
MYVALPREILYEIYDIVIQDGSEALAVFENSILALIHTYGKEQEVAFDRGLPSADLSGWYVTPE